MASLSPHRTFTHFHHYWFLQFIYPVHRHHNCLCHHPCLQYIAFILPRCELKGLSSPQNLLLSYLANLLFLSYRVFSFTSFFFSMKLPLHDLWDSKFISLLSYVSFTKLLFLHKVSFYMILEPLKCIAILLCFSFGKFLFLYEAFFLHVLRA